MFGVRHQIFGARLHKPPDMKPQPGPKPSIIPARQPLMPPKTDSHLPRAHTPSLEGRDESGGVGLPCQRAQPPDHALVQCSRFRVQGSGFRVQGPGLRVEVLCSVFRVWGSGFRVQGAGFRVQSSGCWVGVRPRARPILRRRPPRTRSPARLRPSAHERESLFNL